MERIIELTTDCVNETGAGQGIYDGHTVSVFGMLPGEKGIVATTCKKGVYMGELVELRVSSPSRCVPLELHHLSCSPWQIMDYPHQLSLKRDILEQLFELASIRVSAFHPAEELGGYRTKIEFSFTDRDAMGNPAPLHLAFHMRGSGARRIALPDGCVLASEGMNRAALAVVARLRDAGIPARSLKTVIVRESKSTGGILVLLYVKEEIPIPLTLKDIPSAVGFHVYFSTPQSPASVVTRVMSGEGEDFLVETLEQKDIRYSAQSFFQNNIPMFLKVVERMRGFIPDAARVLELYSGVGTIGLLLSDIAGEIQGVETVPSAVESASKNAALNDIFNYTSLLSSAEKIDPAYLEGIDVLLLDPPRAGLHKNIIQLIRVAPPPLIIYLSCNPATQARDALLLTDLYEIGQLEGFDFYPHTPHMESLLVLRRLV